jgi:hypothetical protein
MSEQQPTRSDPTPEERTGDSSIKPVVIAFAVTILIILVAAIIFMKARQNKAIPTPHDSHPTTRSMPQPKPASGQLRSVLAA